MSHDITPPNEPFIRTRPRLSAPGASTVPTVTAAPVQAPQPEPLETKGAKPAKTTLKQKMAAKAEAKADRKAAAKQTRQPGEDYEVGYAKPPISTQFKPGQSGNRKGRPKEAKGIKRLIRDAMLTKVNVTIGGKIKKITHVEALLLKVQQEASRGNVRLLEFMFRKYEEAVPDSLDLDAGADAEAQPTEADAVILALMKDMLLNEQNPLEDDSDTSDEENGQ